MRNWDPTSNQIGGGIEVNGMIFRNLQEQVLANQNDIKYILSEAGVLNEFGIKVVGVISTAASLPDPSTYQGEFGDAYAVGSKPPYTLYIYTRQTTTTEGPWWFNIGEFPAPSTVPGPQGIQGPQGEEGTRGSLWYSQSGVPTNTNKVNNNDQALDSATGDIYQFVSGIWQKTGNIRGPQGIQGIRGIQGIQGIKGDTGPQGPRGEQGQFIEIVGELDNVSQLPDPTSVPRASAYLIPQGTPAANHIYLIVGETEADLVWTDAGAFASGTTVTANGINLPNVDLTNDITAANYSSGTDAEASVNTNKITFSGLTPSGYNPTGASVQGTAKTIELPIKASDEIEPIVVNKILTFTLTDAIKAQLAAGSSSTQSKVIVISAPTTATQGTLTAEQWATLQESDANYIELNNELYRLQDKMIDSGYVVYTHVGSLQSYQYIKTLTITTTTLAWSLATNQVINSNDRLYVYDMKIACTPASYCTSISSGSSATATKFNEDLSSISASFRFNWTVVTSDDSEDWIISAGSNPTPWSASKITNVDSKKYAFAATHLPTAGNASGVIGGFVDNMKAGSGFIFNGTAAEKEQIAGWRPVGLSKQYSSTKAYKAVPVEDGNTILIPMIYIYITNDTTRGRFFIPLNYLTTSDTTATSHSETKWGRNISSVTINKIQAYPVSIQDMVSGE